MLDRSERLTPMRWDGIARSVSVLTLAALLALVPAGHADDADLDLTFHGDGWSPIDAYGGVDEVSAAAIQPDGKLVLVGKNRPLGGFSSMVVVRLEANGTVDQSFGDQGVAAFGGFLRNDFAHDVAVMSNGRIIVVGYSRIFVSFDPVAFKNFFAIVQFTDAGVVYDSEHIELPGDAKANAVALQPDGKVIVAGASRNGIQPPAHHS